MSLVELALDLASRTLKKDDVFLARVFQGKGCDADLKQPREQFKTVITRKPDASRARSGEVYLLAKGFKG